MLIPAIDLITASLTLYKQHTKLFLKYTFLLFIVQFVAAVIAYFWKLPFILNSATAFIILAIFTLLYIAAQLASIWFSIALIRVIASCYLNLPNPDLKTVLEHSRQLIIQGFIAIVLASLATVGGFVLLFVPGIIFGLWFLFSLHAVSIDSETGLQALSKSKQLAKGRWWPVFWRLFAPGFVFGLIIFIPQKLLELVFNMIATSIQGITFSGVEGLNILLNILNLLITAAVVPLTAGAVTILYIELKKTINKSDTQKKA